MADTARVVYIQPPLKSTPKMDVYAPQDEKHHTHSQQDTCHHRRCHNTRLRQLLFPVLIFIAGLGSLLAITLLYGHSSWGANHEWMGSLVAGSVQVLAKRQNGGAPGDNNDNGVFVDRHLYLIIIFVGLVLVVLLGIMLSAWCCRGAFENPLCCPCYLCACCGGLACLECLGCGLCAAGADQM